MIKPPLISVPVEGFVRRDGAHYDRLEFHAGVTSFVDRGALELELRGLHEGKPANTKPTILQEFRISLDAETIGRLGEALCAYAKEAQRVEQ